MRNSNTKPIEYMGFVIEKEGNHYLVNNPSAYRYINFNAVILPWTEDTVEDAKETIREYWTTHSQKWCKY